MAAKTANNNAITEGVIWKQLLIFFFPLLLGAFFQQMYNTADTIIVGRYLGKEALSAVGGSSGRLIDMLIYVMISLSSGASVVISQLYGAKNYTQTHRAVHTATAFAIILGLTASIIGFIVTPNVLAAIATPVDILPLSIVYMRIYFIGLVPNMLYNMGASILRAVGDSKRPFIFLVITCFVNIFLDLLFIVVLKMGVAGAAIATITSQLISAILVTTTLILSRSSYRLYITNIKIHKNLLLRMMKISIPASIQTLMYNLPNIPLQYYINLLGTDTVAAWSIYSKLEAVFWMIMDSLRNSITTFSGQNYGAGKKARITESAKQCLVISITLTIIISAVFYTFSRPLLELFITSGDVLDIGVKIMHFIPLAYILYSGIDIFSGTIRGMGDSFRPMCIVVCGICIPRVFWLLFVIPSHLNLTALMGIFPFSWGITEVLFIIYFTYFARKHGLIKSKKSETPSQTM